MNPLFIIVFVFLNLLSISAIAQPPTPNEILSNYKPKLASSLNYWETVDFITYQTGDDCQSDETKPYITAKIHELSKMLSNLARIYPHVNSTQKSQIKSISYRIYYWLYRQIDWDIGEIKDDYRLCAYGTAGHANHLTTPFVVRALKDFRSNLKPEDSHYDKLGNVVSWLSSNYLHRVDNNTNITTPNYLASQLTALAAAYAVDSNPDYQWVSSRLINDYGTIRKDWINYSHEFWCAVDTKYGSWPHNNYTAIANQQNTAFNCTHLDPNNTTKEALAFRKGYRQYVSYHTIISHGISDILEYLESSNNCTLVNYGSNGTCKEMRMILNGSAYWLYNLIRTDYRMNTGFFPVKEIGEHVPVSTLTSVKGLAILMELLDRVEVLQRNDSLKGGLDGVIDRLYIEDIENKLLYALDKAVDDLKNHEQTIILSDAVFLAQKIK